MTPRRRFLSAVYRGHVDKVPACTLSSVVTVEMMDLVNAPFPEAHLDAELMARLAATAHDVFDMDTIMPVFHSQLESDALGGETEWAEKDNWPSPSRFTHRGAGAGQGPGRLRQAPDDGRRDRGDQAAAPALSGRRDRGQGLRPVVGRLPDGRHRELPDGRDARPGQDQALPRRVPAGLHRVGASPVRGRRRRDHVGRPHDRATCAAPRPTATSCSRCTSTSPRRSAARASSIAAARPSTASTSSRPRAGTVFHFESQVDAREAREAAGERMALMGNLNNPTLL